MLLQQLAGAMSVLRSKGIIHRDLKPQNILLSYSTGRKANPNNICIKLGECSGSKYTVLNLQLKETQRLVMDQYVLIMGLGDYELSGLAVVGCGVFVLVL